MIKVQKLGKLLEPTLNPFESKAVLNPGVYQEGNIVHMLYRAVDNDGISSLGYVKFDGPDKIVERWDKPFMAPKKRYECKGIEDPRLMKIGDTLYATYVVHDGKNAVTAFASGKDILSLSREFVISPKIPYKEAGKIFAYSKLKDDYYFFQAYYQNYSGSNILIWHKDVMFFPEKINGNYFLLQRILPDVQVMEFEDFGQLKEKYFWIHYLLDDFQNNVVLEGEHGFENRHVGGGCPPIKTEFGWLLIYHSTEESNSGRVYHAGAALLDLNNPRKLLARLPYPLFSPTEDYERNGDVNNVVFPTGTAQFGDDLYIYYGCADRIIGLAKVNMKELLEELLKNKV